jgi:hypothetical protein
MVVHTVVRFIILVVAQSVQSQVILLATMLFLQVLLSMVVRFLIEEQLKH